MINIMDNLKSLFKVQTGPTNSLIRIIKNRKGVLKSLVDSHENGSVIGIYCPNLGEGMFLVGVEDISNEESEEVITFKKYDLNGILLQRNHVSVSEIKSVCPFNAPYVNPLFNTNLEYV